MKKLKKKIIASILIQLRDSTRERERLLNGDPDGNGCDSKAPDGDDYNDLHSSVCHALRQLGIEK